MEEKNHPEEIQSEKTENSSVITKKTFTPRLIMVILAIAVCVIVATIFLLTKKTDLLTSPQNSVNPPITSSPRTNEWKTYTNTEAGFSLRYPSSVLLGTEVEGATQPVLLINVEKLSNIPEDLPSFMGRKDVLMQKALLEKGSGESTVKIGSLNGALDMTLSQFEICSVILNRSVTFYPGDYRVIISLTGQKETIIDSMPEFFMVDKANCGTNRIWKTDISQTFISTLAQKKGRGAAQEWYDTFDAIVNTITLSTPTTTSIEPTKIIANLLIYKNLTHGFEISYPKSYKAVDGKDDLAGYPEGVVLFYSGGQAYDVVVEVWNTEAEYKKKYETMMSDVTAIKNNGKFITLLNSTHQPENAQIIASFKLVSN